MALHRAGQTYAERLHRELQWALEGRTPERDVVHVSGQVRMALGCWRADYNDTRPHSQLGWKTPSEFAMTYHPRRDLALRYAEGSAPAPVATTAQMGKSNDRGELRNG
ncbi:MULTISPECIES: integrase core domain-containing protein [Bradyrhizobium]